MTISTQIQHTENVAACVYNCVTQVGGQGISASRPGWATQAKPCLKTVKEKFLQPCSPVTLFYFPFLILPLFQSPNYAFPRGAARLLGVVVLCEQSVPCPSLPSLCVGPLRCRPLPRLWEHCRPGVSVKASKQGPGLYTVREKIIRVFGL